MFERIKLLAGLESEEGQGATEYAMVMAFLVVTLGLGVGVLGEAIVTFLGEVATAVGNLIP